jgi:CheY-like chemotaxis protein
MTTDIFEALEFRPARAPVATRGIALVVDDDPTSRLALRSMVGRAGYLVQTAADGATAIELYARTRFDLVFMDVAMPGMDGREAARRIKTLAGDDFVPVIFVTGATEEAEMAACIEAGGDDFLPKPCSRTLLQARIQAMERIRDLHRRTARMYERLREEQALAESLHTHAVMGRNARAEGVAVSLLPAATFNGDMVLIDHGPDRTLNLLIGDFTGHGLVAALGALPAAEAFRTMTRKGLPGPTLLCELNALMLRLLPRGKFLAATLVSIPPALDGARIWNCGMPPALLLRHGACTRIESAHVPLGVTRLAPADFTGETPHTAAGDTLLLASDGVFETDSPDGVQFGVAAVEALLLATPIDAVPERLAAALARHRQDAAQADDVSFATVALTPALFPDTEAA